MIRFPVLVRALLLGLALWSFTVRDAPDGGLRAEIGAPAAAGVQIFGCTIWVFNPKATADCLIGKVKAEFEKGKSAVLGLGVDILGCRASLGNIPGAFACLRGKIAKAASDARNAVLGQGVDILGCRASLGDIPGAFACLKNQIKTKAEALAAKVGGALTTVALKLKPAFDCMGVPQATKMFAEAFANPSAFFQGFFGKVFGALKKAAKPILDSGLDIIQQVISGLTGNRVADATLNKILDWMWGRLEDVAGVLPPAKCLMKFVRPLKAQLAPIAKAGLAFVLDLPATLLELIQSKVLPFLTKHGEPILDKVLGEDAVAIKNRIKGAIAKVIDPTAMMERAAQRLQGFMAALNKRAPDLRARWADARALITTANDFGLRKVVAVVEVAIHQIIDWLTPLIIDKVFMKVADLVPILIDRLDGVCGLIPEVGGLICTPFIGLLSVVWTWVGRPVLTKLLQPLVGGIISAVAKPVVTKIATVLQAQVTAPLDKAIATSTVLGRVAGFLAPVMDLVYRMAQSVIVPTAHRVNAFNQRVAELGDAAVAMATAKGGAPVAHKAAVAPARPVVAASFGAGDFSRPGPACPAAGERLRAPLRDGALWNLARLKGARVRAAATIPGWSARHQIPFLNDGWYGNCRSWIPAAMPGWVEVDLGAEHTLDYVSFASDRRQQYRDRAATELTLVVKNAAGKVVKRVQYGKGAPPISMTTTLPLARVRGRFVRIDITKSHAAQVRIDELEIWGSW